MPLESLFRNRRAVVTGGAGFIGSHLAERLFALGARVTVLDDFSTGSADNLRNIRDGITVIEGDIRDRRLLEPAFHEVDFVFHQAALISVPASLEDPAACMDVNVTGATAVFQEAARAEVRAIVYASSCAVYGNSDALPLREDGPMVPLSPYALSKRFNEETADWLSRSAGVPTAGLRYFNVYGPRQDPEGPYAAVIPRFILRALRGEPLIIHGDGSQTRDFVHVRDVVRANLLAAVAGRPGLVANVCSGDLSSIDALAGSIEAALPGTTREHGPARKGDVSRSWGDGRHASEALGFDPEIPLVSGLADTIDWFRHRKDPPSRGAAG